jgi:hypothetical protein
MTGVLDFFQVFFGMGLTPFPAMPIEAINAAPKTLIRTPLVSSV